MHPVNILVAVLSIVSTASSCEYHEEDHSFVCDIRTLQSGFSSHFDINKANKLNLKCSDFSFAESVLSSEHFGNLPFLNELSIDYCKIRTIPQRAFSGLSSLKQLTVQSHNSEWSSVVMEIDAKAFQNLVSLEKINFAQNNIWTVPSGSFCELGDLTSLNLSHNHIVAVADIGLAEGGCELPITELDLSSNFIAKFEAGDLSAVDSNLVKLDLSSNRLSVLGDNCLSGLESLKQLSWAHNNLAALPPTLFGNSSLKNLQSLHLENNSLSLLTPGIFKGLDDLKILNLSLNAISSHLLTGDTFSGLDRLQVLDLSHNDITKLEPAVFKSLIHLQILSLSNNKLHIISDKAFMSQSHLRVLSLSFNNLEEISEEAMDGLTGLESLSLDNNRIAAIKLKTSNVFNLKDLAINDNLLTAVPSFVRDSKSIRTLDLGNNKISTDITDQDFQGLAELYGLRLAGNAIKSISNQTFTTTTNIHILNLAHNEMKVIESGAFSPLKKLRALRLDNNELEDINGVVSSLPDLEWFNVSSNKLQWFDYAFISSSLVWIDISHNEIGELGNFYDLDNFGIKTIDASFNQIKKIGPKSFPPGLKHIDLRSNGLEDIEVMTFAHQDNLEKIDLSDNGLKSFVKEAVRVSSRNGRPDLNLAGNPLQCDCYLSWLKDFIGQTNSLDYANLVNYDSLECMVPTENEVKLVREVDPESFMCEYKAHCSSDCMCCDFYACDCRFQCPDGCKCFHDRLWTKNVVQCSSKNHNRVPLLIPLDATEVRLDGNNLKETSDTQSFLGRSNVKQLFLNDSNIVTLGNHTFSGLTSLQVLHLEDNNIGELHGYEFQSLTALRELYLHNNDLVYINEIAFEALRNLRTLTLDGNLLTVFPVWHLLSNPRLNELTLSRNTWSCDCDFIQPFNFFLEKKSTTIRDYELIQCVSDNIIDEKAIREGHQRCGNPKETSSSVKSTSLSHNQQFEMNLIPIIVPLIVVVVLIFVGALAIFVFRKSIKNWLYAKSSEIYESRSGSSLASQGTYGQTKLFDVYISYSNQDAEFVDQTLAPTLEHGANASYKLCLHQRDFPPNASVFDTVTVAAESSARTVIVLTKSYLNTEWIHVRVPLKNSISNASEKLVFVLRESLHDEDLTQHPDLIQLLRSCAVIQWGAPGFLNKLRLCLPEPAFLTFQRNITLRNQSRPPMPLPNPPPYGLQADQIGTIYRGNLNPMIQYQSYSLYNAGRSDHTYHSIPDNHIYHTLSDPKGVPSSVPKSALALSRNLELVLRPEVPSPISPSLMYHHAHSHSASSGTQLLPSTPKDKTEEYIV